MNMKTITAIATAIAPEPAKPPKQKQWYVNLQDISVLLGKNRDIISRFLEEQSVPYYKIGSSKSFFLPEVLEAVEKTRWGR